MPSRGRQAPPPPAAAAGAFERLVPWLLAAAVVAATVLAVRHEVRRHRDATAADSVWIAATGAFVLFAIVGTTLWLRERRVAEHAQRQLREQAARMRHLSLLQAIGESSLDAIFAKDTEGRYLLCNREAARVLGQPAAAVLGRDDRALFAPAQAAAVMANDRAVMAGARAETFEENVRTPDGDITFLTTKGPLRDGEGRVVGVFGIARDITERKRAERAVQEAAEFVQAVEDSVLDHLAVIDARGVIVAVNAAWRRFAEDNGGDAVGVGVGADYLATCRAARGDAAVDARAAAEGLAGVLAGRLPHFSLEYACHAPGRQRWFRLEAAPLATAAGGAVVTHTDVTGQHVAQAQLRQLSLAVEQSPVAIVVADTDGRIEYVNEAFERMTGIPKAAAGGRLRRVLQPARGPQDALEAMRAALVRGQAWAGELANARADGGAYDEFVHATPVRQPGGRVTHVLSIEEDISEHKRIGAELDRHRHRLEELVAERTAQLSTLNDALVESRDRAEAASRAKSAFLANMSHEIRTPMNAIIGLTHLMQRDMRDPVGRQRLDKVGDAAAQLLQIIDDILDLSAIEAGRLDLEHEDFSLRDLVSRTAKGVAGRAAAKGLAFERVIDDVPDALCGDATRIGQALLNLLSNAVKFTERGAVRLRVRRLEAAGALVKLEFRVQDTGIGIEPARVEGLFGAFVQADASTTRRFGGTGLGLAITQRLAEMMGGEAGVTSELGVGSEFWFTAVLRTGARAAAADAAAPAETAPAAPDVASELPAIDGIDAPAALAALGGSVALLRRILRQFCAHYGEGGNESGGEGGGDELTAALHSRDAGRAAAAAHSVRGAALSIGAQGLARQAAALEEEARRGAWRPGLAAAMRSLQHDLQALAGRIGDALVDQPTAPAPLADGSEAPLDLALLEQLLRSGDFEAYELARGRSAGGDALLERVLEATRRFEFEAALHALRELRAAHGPAARRRSG